MAATSDLAPHSQTLSRGINILEVLATAGRPLSIAQLAAALGVHRSVAYRILRTLEDHNLVARDPSGGVRLGARLAELSQAVSRELQVAALPELTAVANDLTMTAFLAVMEGKESVILTSIEPRHQAATIVYRPGSRHPVTHGAPGIAIQSLLDETQWKAAFHDEPRRPDVEKITTIGYVTTRGEVIRGMAATAVPLSIPGEMPTALAVVYVESELSEDQIGQRLLIAAQRIESAFSQ
ncbi:helix-turn-helix domain-containing protein [Leifsonia bigeumensis]|uniref:Helix-turn-helix domain-containing protein n=1 Tax=Leifsonella bigeumensis TaxID=433643 RepID=A0ABP7FAZ1_9MICO